MHIITNFKRPLFYENKYHLHQKSNKHIFHNVHNVCTKFEKDPLKTIRGVDYTDCIPSSSVVWSISRNCICKTLCPKPHAAETQLKVRDNYTLSETK